MADSSRDDFTEATRRHLAESAGFRCSFPGCGVPTVGPSDEGGVTASRIGMAAHIAAAAPGPGARRYDGNMTPAERSSAANGIWMCYTHGKLIDTDEVRFTTTMLKRWKALAELRARIELESGGKRTLTPEHLDSTGLAPDDVLIAGLGNENTTIGQAIDYSCLPAVWGTELADAVRDFVIEVTRNALTHGGATVCELSISDSTVLLVDDGKRFDPWKLPARTPGGSGGGGTATVRRFLTDFGGHVVVGSRRVKARNEVRISVVRSPDEIGKVTHCVVKMKRAADLPVGVLTTVKSCSIIYVILPDYFTTSDLFAIRDALKKLAKLNKHLVFVATRTSSFVRKQVIEAYPEAIFMEMD